MHTRSAALQAATLVSGSATQMDAAWTNCTSPQTYTGLEVRLQDCFLVLPLGKGVLPLQVPGLPVRPADDPCLGHQPAQAYPSLLTHIAGGSLAAEHSGHRQAGCNAASGRLDHQDPPQHLRHERPRQVSRGWCTRGIGRRMCLATLLGCHLLMVVPISQTTHAQLCSR